MSSDKNTGHFARGYSNPGGHSHPCPSDVVQAREHLLTEWGRRAEPLPKRPNEAICASCGARVTVDPNDGTEYGHCKGEHGGRPYCDVRREYGPER
jgi:hypothetical protein